MAKKGALFKLIHSLSKAEKRYFKLFAKQSGDQKNYLELFDAIDRQESYDEAAIREQFKDRSFTKQLHVTKIYLTKLILKSLRNFYHNWSAEAELKDLLRDIELLFSKELFDACNYAIIKAEKLARDFEKFTVLLEILGWKRRLLLTRVGPFQAKVDIQQLIAEEATVLKQMEHINRYWELTFAMYQFQPGAKNNLSHHFAHPLLTNQLEFANSLQAKSLYHHIRYALFSVNSQFAEAQQEMELLAQELERHPHRIREDPSGYITCLNNKTSLQLFQKNPAAVLKSILETRAVPSKFKIRNRKQVEVKLLLRTYNVEIELYRDTADYAKGIALAKPINAFLEKYKDQVPQEYVLSFYYQFSYLYFISSDYKPALRWLNQVFNTPFGDTRQDMQTYARFLNLMIHLELDNTVVLKYAVDACRRFLRKKRNPAPFEQVLLAFFSKVCLVPKAQYPQLFAQLYKDLFQGEGMINSSVLDYIDFKTWIEGHLKKQPVAVVFPK